MGAGVGVQFDDPLAVGDIGEWNIKQFRVALDLLETVSNVPEKSLSLDRRDWQAIGILKDIVRDQRSFLPVQARGGADPPLVNRVLNPDLLFFPARPVQRRQHELAAGLVLAGTIRTGRHSTILTLDRSRSVLDKRTVHEQLLHVMEAGAGEHLAAMRRPA